MSLTRSIVAIALTTLAFSAPAMAQFGPMEDDVGNSVQAVPELKLEQSTIDLGTISDDEPKSMKVGFKNSGTGLLVISDVRGSCGCTVPQLPKREYKPGEGGVIDITFNPHGKRDAQHTTVTISSNDPKQPSTMITLNSVVRPTVFFDPQVVTFNQVEKGKGGKATLKVTGRLENFEVKEVTSTVPGSISAKVLETKPVAQADGKPGYESTIEVTLNPATPVGMVQANLTIRTNNEKSPLLNVSSFAEVTGDLQTTPVKFFLNMLQPGQEYSSTVTIRHRGNKPFKISKAEIAKIANGVEHTVNATFKAENDQANSYVITLTGTAPTTNGAIQGDVVLTTDIPGEEAVKVGYFGMVQVSSPKPQFPVDPRGGPGGPSASTKPGT